MLIKFLLKKLKPIISEIVKEVTPVVKKKITPAVKKIAVEAAKAWINNKVQELDKKY